MTSPVRLLLIEDYLPTVAGLRSALEQPADTGTPQVAVLDRYLPTTEDAVAFFEGAARHGGEALRNLPLDGALVDGLMPRNSEAPYSEFAAAEIAIRITAIYDRAGIDEPDRPRLILTTASPDPCDIRGFVAYGGAGVIEKTSLSPEELRRRIIAIVAEGERWEPPTPTVPHTYQAGFGRYLRGIELGASNTAIAERIGAAPESLARIKNQLRHAFDLPQRATDSEIVDAAKVRGITWIPLRHEEVAKRFGVRPRIEQW